MAESLPSKQVVAGSNPVSRSPRLTRRLAVQATGLTAQLARYRLDACARGYSDDTITHTELCVSFFNAFLGGIDDVARISADDLRRFIVCLRDKNPGSQDSRRGRKLSPTTINTYVRAIRSFWRNCRVVPADYSDTGYQCEYSDSNNASRYSFGTAGQGDLPEVLFRHGPWQNPVRWTTASRPPTKCHCFHARRLNWCLP